MRARPWSDAIFANIHAFDIRCSRSVLLQPPGRTPAVVARGTRAFCLVRAMPFAPSMACPARGRSAPFLVLRAVPWRRILSYASLPCRRNGLRAWRPARLLLGDVWLSSSSCFCYVLSHRHGRSWCVFLGQQCYANVVAKAHFVGGGVRERVPRRDLREHPGAHYEMRARPWSDAIFASIHAFDIMCSRSVVLQPPGRTPAMVAQGTQASLFGEGDALRPMV